MPTFLSDPPPALYLVLAGVVTVLGAIAAQRQDRRSAVRFLVALAVLATLYLFDRFNLSPREGAVGAARDMAAAADAMRPDDFVKHVADTLVYQGEGQPVTATRAQLQKSQFWNMLRQFNAHIAVWNFSRGDVREVDDNTVEIGFMAKGETRGELKGVQLYVRATFKRQPDGSMKMTEFRTFDPVNHQKPFTIPNFPN